MNEVRIDKVDNGYIVESATNDKVFTSLDDVFEFLLQHFEGLADIFHENFYGKVTIIRGEENKK